MVGQRYLELRSQLGATLGSLVALAQQIGAPPETLRNVRNLNANLHEPFLFVVVGEVKAGKSSLLNALFGQNFCKVDVLPATDKIYVFKHGDTEKDVAVSENLTERYRNIEFLRDFNIVDTPGTNTIVAHHQEITVNFVPMADLIVFVFSVTNPWAASAWDFLKLIGGQWKKNIVFVVQQADLREPHEVDVVVRHLEQTTLNILGSTCPIFPVSARKALSAKSTNHADRDRLLAESNFPALEQWITETVSHSEERGGKLRSVSQTAQVVVAGLRARLQGSLDLLRADLERVVAIRGSLESRRQQTLRQVGGFLREIEQAYDACRARGESFLRERLSFGQTLKLIFSGGRWERDFQDQVESEVKKEVQSKMEHALSLLETDLRSIWQDLQERVQLDFGLDSRRQVRAMVPGFLGQREAILQRLRLTLVEQMSDAQIGQQLQSLFGETAAWLRLPTGVAAVGGVATIIAALTHTAVLDVTGTVAGLAAVTGTVYAVIRRRKILKEYRARMTDKRQELSLAVETQLRNAIAIFYQEVAQTFAPLESFCEAETKRHQPLLDQLQTLDDELGRVKSESG
jgi:GTPase SAR1 family protein